MNARLEYVRQQIINAREDLIALDEATAYRVVFKSVERQARRAFARGIKKMLTDAPAAILERPAAPLLALDQHLRAALNALSEQKLRKPAQKRRKSAAKRS